MARHAKNSNSCIDETTKYLQSRKNSDSSLTLEDRAKAFSLCSGSDFSQSNSEPKIIRRSILNRSPERIHIERRRYW
mgnify:CR=1 FL=1